MAEFDEKINPEETASDDISEAAAEKADEAASEEKQAGSQIPVDRQFPQMKFDFDGAEEIRITDEDPEEEESNPEGKSPEGTLEALLFAMGDSVELNKLADIIGRTPAQTRKILDRMAEEYEAEDRGIRLLDLDGSYQLCTKKQYYEDLIRLAKQPKKPRLTSVVIETLSIIAYKQPVTKAEIERIRGVSSEHAVNKLLEYDLIEEQGRLDAPGHPILLGTTERFLRYFGISSPKELPSLSKAQLEKFKMEAQQEVTVDV